MNDHVDNAAYARAQCLLELARERMRIRERLVRAKRDRHEQHPPSVDRKRTHACAQLGELLAHELPRALLRVPLLTARVLAHSHRALEWLEVRLHRPDAERRRD